MLILNNKISLIVHIDENVFTLVLSAAAPKASTGVIQANNLLNNKLVKK